MFAREFLFKKNYELLSRIGEGTYATVYKAKRISDSVPVAVKMINVFKMDKKKIENALNEIRIICAIDHPNVVGYHEAFLDQTNKDLYIIMEFVGGGDLNDRIRNLTTRKKYLNEATIWKYTIQILQGLKVLHDRKIIHRDIKPGNIFVSEDLEELKIGDLNVSKIMRNQMMTATVIGTPYYLAPEIWKNDRYDYRCDVFSFGCVLYEMTALRVPFQGKSIGELYKSVENDKPPPLPNQFSNDLYQFILRCLIKKFAKRPSVNELLNDPMLLKRKQQFQDVVHRDTSRKVRLTKLKVETLTDLSRILPSLKNMRSSSVTNLAMASSSFDKNYNSGRNFQNYSQIMSLKPERGGQLNKSYKTKKKRGWAAFPEQIKLPRRKFSDKNQKQGKRSEHSREMQSRKKYSKLAKIQKLKRDKLRKERKETSKSKRDSQFKNRPELELVGLDAEIIQIIDDLANEGAEDKVVIVRKRDSSRRRHSSRRQESSMDKRGTLKQHSKASRSDKSSLMFQTESNKETGNSKMKSSLRQSRERDKSKTSLHMRKVNNIGQKKWRQAEVQIHSEGNLPKSINVYPIKGARESERRPGIKSERNLSKKEQNQRMIEKEKQFFLNRNSKNSKSTQQLQINYFPDKKNKEKSQQKTSQQTNNKYETIKEMPDEGTTERIYLGQSRKLGEELRKEEHQMRIVVAQKSTKFMYSAKRSPPKKKAKAKHAEKPLGQSKLKSPRKNTSSSNFESYSSKYAKSRNKKNLVKIEKVLFKKKKSRSKKLKSKTPKHRKKSKKKQTLTSSHTPKNFQRTKSDHAKDHAKPMANSKCMFKKTDPSIEQSNHKNYLFPQPPAKKTTSSLNMTQQDSDNLMESVIDSLEQTHSKERFRNRKAPTLKEPQKQLRFKPNTNPNSPKNLKVKIKQKRFSTHKQPKKSSGINIYSELSKKSFKSKKQNRFSGPSQKKKILVKGQNKYMDLLEKKKFNLVRKKSPKINLYQAINLKSNPN